MKKRAVLMGFLVFCLIAIVLLAISLFCLFLSVPNIDLNLKKLENYAAKVEILDSSGSKLSTTSHSGLQSIELANLPSYVPQAFISIEDKNFYSHHGLNYTRIIKAGIKNLISHSPKEGASTITQQLIKNTHLNSEKTLKRKIQEAILAKKLEKMFSKDEILATYLNVIYFGSQTYGIESASRLYFNHSASLLSLEESATLAAIIKSPKTYSPIYNPHNCLNRRNLVLKNMLNDGYISSSEYENALKKPIELSLNLSNNTTYLKLVVDEATKILNLSENDVSTTGLKIQTYLDKNLQTEVEKLPQSINHESAFLVLDNKTNGVVSMVGNATFNRQVGSTIKPLLCYAPAFENGILSPITPILDEKITFGNYSPQNVDKKFHGWVSVRNAVASSLNIPAVKTLNYIGVPNGVDFAKNLGLEFSKNDNHLALALGASENGQTLLNITNAYSSFARMGQYSDIHFIRQIESNTGKVLYTHSPTFKSMFSDSTAFLINDTLSDCVKLGTAKKLNSLNLNLCAKTGTVGSSDKTNTDAWCISYTPEFTVGVWAGNITNDPNNNLSSTQNGGTICAKYSVPIWEYIKNKNLLTTFSPPPSVKKVYLDSLSLQNQKIELASETTPQRFVVCDYFAKKYLPQKTSSNFILPPIPELKLSENNSNLSFSWDGVDFLNYELWCKNKSHTRKICSLSGKNSTLSYKIKLPKEDNEYYLVCKFNFNDNQTFESNIVKYTALDKSETKKILSNWLKKEPKP